MFSVVLYVDALWPGSDLDVFCVAIYGCLVAREWPGCFLCCCMWTPCGQRVTWMFSVLLYADALWPGSDLNVFYGAICGYLVAREWPGCFLWCYM